MRSCETHYDTNIISEELRYSLDERVVKIKDRPTVAEGQTNLLKIWYNGLWEFKHNRRGAVMSYSTKLFYIRQRYLMTQDFKEPNMKIAHIAWSFVTLLPVSNLYPINAYMAIEINPNYAEVYNNLGITYNGMGKKEDAIDAFRKTAEIKPDYATVYFNLGIIYKDIGEVEEVISSFKKAVDIKPDHAKSYYNLSKVYLSNQQYKLAIEYYDKAKS